MCRTRTYYYHALIAFLFSLIFFPIMSFGVLVETESGVPTDEVGLIGIVSMSSYFLILIGVYRARIIRQFYSSIRLSDGIAVKCSISASRYFFAYATVNFFAIILSLGLLIPWVRVRTWRYISENLVILQPMPGSVLGGPEEKVTPLGEEFVDLNSLDFDVGII